MVGNLDFNLAKFLEFAGFHLPLKELWARCKLNFLLGIVPILCIYQAGFAIAQGFCPSSLNCKSRVEILVIHLALQMRPFSTTYHRMCSFDSNTLQNSFARPISKLRSFIEAVMTAFLDFAILFPYLCVLMRWQGCREFTWCSSFPLVVSELVEVDTRYAALLSAAIAASFFARGATNMAPQVHIFCGTACFWSSFGLLYDAMLYDAICPGSS